MDSHRTDCYTLPEKSLVELQDCFHVFKCNATDGDCLGLFQCEVCPSEHGEADCHMAADFVHLVDFRVVPSDPVAGPVTHSVLWNAMIHPLQNMTLKGVVWYQGKLALSPLVSVSFCCVTKNPKVLMVSKPSEFIIFFSPLSSG